MFRIGETIHSNVSGKSYTITWASSVITQAEVGFASTPSEGNSFFIKRLLSMKYPTEAAKMSERMKAFYRTKCDNHFKKYSALYNQIYNGCGPTSACVPIEDYFRDGVFYYTVYRKINADSLTLTEIAVLPEQEKYKLLQQLVLGLMPLHSLGVIHGDLKPDNILIQREGDGWKILLIDMNDCYPVGNPNPPQEVIGTPDYYSPELYEYNTYEIEDPEDPAEMAHVEKMSQALTTKSDIFALGVIFCEFFTGKRPVIEDDSIHYHYDAANKGVIKFPASMPTKFADILGRMLDKDPDKRPSITQLGNDIKGLIIGEYFSEPTFHCAKVEEDEKKVLMSIIASPNTETYYTLDGTEPGKSSIRYTGEFVVPKFTQIKAISFNSKGRKSLVSQISAWVKTPPKVSSKSPSITVNGRMVTMDKHASSPEGTMIFYTLDGTKPTVTSNVYDGPFEVAPGVTKVMAAALETSDPTVSKIMSYVVEINVYKQKVEKPNIRYRFGEVNFEVPEGLSVHYTEDGSVPTASSKKFEAPFKVADVNKFHIRAVSVDKFGEVSEVSEIKRPTSVLMKK